MGGHNGLRIRLSQAGRKRLEELLSGGVQPVRAVIRALVLRQLDQGRSTVEARVGTGISAKVARETGKRNLECGLECALDYAPDPDQKPLRDPEHGQHIVATPPPTYGTSHANRPTGNCITQPYWHGTSILVQDSVLGRDALLISRDIPILSR
jgi:hypothetical protein